MKRRLARSNSACAWASASSIGLVQRHERIALLDGLGVPDFDAGDDAADCGRDLRDLDRDIGVVGRDEMQACSPVGCDGKVGQRASRGASSRWLRRCC